MTIAATRLATSENGSLRICLAETGCRFGRHQLCWRHRYHYLGDRLEKKPLDWSYLAGYFDANGSLRESKQGKGPRLRINSYSLHLIEEIRQLIDSGSISREQKPRGEYYRLDITGPEHAQRILQEISPFLRVKTVSGGRMAEFS